VPIDANAQANAAGLPALAEHQSTLGPGFRLSPRTTGTDGFYIATLTRDVRGELRRNPQSPNWNAAPQNSVQACWLDRALIDRLRSLRGPAGRSAT
jgi:hypothetical protein